MIVIKTKKYVIGYSYKHEYFEILYWMLAIYDERIKLIKAYDKKIKKIVFKHPKYREKYLANWVALLDILNDKEKEIERQVRLRFDKPEKVEFNQKNDEKMASIVKDERAFFVELRKKKKVKYTIFDLAYVQSRGLVANELVENFGEKFNSGNIKETEISNEVEYVIDKYKLYAWSRICAYYEEGKEDDAINWYENDKLVSTILEMWPIVMKPKEVIEMMSAGMLLYGDIREIVDFDPDDIYYTGMSKKAKMNLVNKVTWDVIVAIYLSDFSLFMSVYQGIYCGDWSYEFVKYKNNLWDFAEDFAEDFPED